MTRVLVVDDAEDNAYYLRALFEGHGWVVETARHGAEALDKARLAPVDLVISDLLMPVMDGFALLRQWKGDPCLCRAPFVVYTATYTGSDDEQLAHSLGADAFILKPAEPEPLILRLRDLLGRGARPGPAPAAAPGDETVLLRQYSESLIRKLEEKMLQLEASNQTLQREEAVLRMRDRAIQAVSQGIIITDALAPDEPIVYVSPGFERLTGYAHDEIQGANCRFLQGPGTEPSAVAQLQEAVRARRACTVELLNYRKDGRPFWNNIAVTPVTDADDRVTHFVGVQTDVTERRELEAQLRQSQKMEALGTLAGGVAHDFNNLLSVILSYSEIILGELPEGDPHRADVDEVRRAGERAADLVRQLLAFSRQQRLQPRLVDLGQLVAGMEKMLRRVLGEDVGLTLRAYPGLGSVYADPGQIEQIVMNLVVNARDAMPGGGALRVETRAVEIDADDDPIRGLPAGAYVQLVVADTGVGMDAATRERIFEPFYTTKDKGKGTGLGLSTVFGIVSQSQGHIGVDSEPGQGATFTISLPRVDHASDPPPRAALAPTSLLGTETVLLVEDDEQVLTMASAILRRHGYTVLDAENGGEAFLISEQHPGAIDLLLTDVVMPRMSGKQLAQRLRADRPAMKVIYMSGYADGPVGNHGVHGHEVAMLPKPITAESLLRRVREILDR